MYVIRHYVRAGGEHPFLEWLGRLRDPLAKVQVLRRLNRAERGNLGEHRWCGEGIWELKIDYGPGYRVYCAKEGRTLLVLLCGGTKSGQQEAIARALAFWKDWQKRGSP